MAAGILAAPTSGIGWRALRCTIPGTAAQFGGNLPCKALYSIRRAGKLGLHPLGLGAAGQQQGTFHLHQMGGHVNELAGYLHAVILQVCGWWRCTGR